MEGGGVGRFRGAAGMEGGGGDGQGVRWKVFGGYAGSRWIRLGHRVSLRQRNGILPVQDQFPECISPLICLHLRVSHQPVPHTGTEDLKHVLFLCHSLHLYNIMNIDEPLGGFSLRCRLLLLVVL